MTALDLYKPHSVITFFFKKYKCTAVYGYWPRNKRSQSHKNTSCLNPNGYQLVLSTSGWVVGWTDERPIFLGALTICLLNSRPVSIDVLSFIRRRCNVRHRGLFRWKKILLKKISKYLCRPWYQFPGIIVGKGSANERRLYIVMASLIGWAHAHTDPRIPCAHSCRNHTQNTTISLTYSV